jgi:hypothetical protein
MATRKMKATALPEGLSEEAREEILERRRAVEAEHAAREAERQSAWVEHERERKDAEERRKATEPPKEFQEAAKAARERFEKERIEHWRESFQKECKRRNPDDALEERFREEEPEMAERHLAVYARFQDAMTGGEAEAERQSVADMAAAWKEKETTLAVLATSKKRGPSAKAEARLEAKSESLKEKLADLEKSKAAAVKKPKAKKTAAPKKKK